MTGFLSIPQAAERIGITRQRLHQLIKAGRVHTTELVGRQVLTDKQADELLAELRIARVKFSAKRRRRKAA